MDVTREMTREEAIAFFEDMNECTYGNLEAVEMAIEALNKCDKIEKIIDSCDPDFIANYVRGLFVE
jgi:hypothetical protein